MSSAGRILVVDDDDTIRELVAMALADEGYEVMTAANGLQALDLVGAVRPDLIILDMRMPVMDGWEFAQAYRRAPAPHAAILVLTAGCSAAEAAADVGAGSFLAKPFELDSLLGAVAHTLDGHHAAA